MKPLRLLLILSLAPLALFPLACNLPITSPPAPALPTATPTPNLTPVCGYTQIDLGSKSGYTGPTVILNASDWNNFSNTPSGLISIPGAPTPTPGPAPVDFNSQMLILYYAMVCPSHTIQVTGVCEGPTQVTISADQVQLCVSCYTSANWVTYTGLVVPKSNLPVVWDYTIIPCPSGAL